MATDKKGSGMTDMCNTCSGSRVKMVEVPCVCVVSDDTPGKTTRRSASPDTQRRSAQTVKTGTQRWRLFQAYSVEPGTDEEMGRRLSLGGNSVRPRRGELMEMGFVKPTGECRPTSTGHDAAVWGLTAAGYAWWIAK